MVSLGEQDALAQQVGFRSSVHLSFDHLDAVDVAFDGAGSPGQGEAGGDGGPVLAQAGGEAPHFLDGAGLGLVDLGGSSLPWRWGDHVAELADQGAGGVELGTAGGDGGQPRVPSRPIRARRAARPGGLGLAP